MATELQRRKYELIFDRFDADHDGVLGETDISAFAQLWCDAFNAAPRSEEWAKINKLASKMWREIGGSTDADGDKMVSKEEWYAAMENPDFVDKVAVPFSLAAFDLADRDGDGKISLEEMIAAQSKGGMSEEETREVFHKLDTDNDGYVERDEFAQAVRDFYLSDDPNAPGNLLAGNL
jgi:Ca2+-binding EF-hand superfamily protein